MRFLILFGKLADYMKLLKLKAWRTPLKILNTSRSYTCRLIVLKF